jgi:two-component system sensor histidine kinase TctE
MLQEALINVLTNCIVHGGPELTWIEVEMSGMSTAATLSISNDGAVIDAGQRVLAIGGFS